eukprot:1137194-Pelagomonas_calceolata.AAC.6
MQQQLRAELALFEKLYDPTTQPRPCYNQGWLGGGGGSTTCCWTQETEIALRAKEGSALSFSFLAPSLLHDASCDERTQAAVINLDDPAADLVKASASAVPVVTYGIDNPDADVYAETAKMDIWESEVGGWRLGKAERCACFFPFFVPALWQLQPNNMVDGGLEKQSDASVGHLVPVAPLFCFAAALWQLQPDLTVGGGPKLQASADQQLLALWHQEQPAKDSVSS